VSSGANADRSGAALTLSGDLLFSCIGVSVSLPHDAGIRRGEVFTIVGPSGTGKTTLIRVLGGLQPLTTGSVRINGRNLTGPPEEVVIVFHDYSHALLQWRTVARWPVRIADQ
jgi:NitT/TauT family transport system ATP-binding protein